MWLCHLNLDFYDNNVDDSNSVGTYVATNVLYGQALCLSE